MTIRPASPRYLAYLLRFWEERSRLPDGPVVWRFSLDDPRTGTRRGFATLEALVAAVREELADGADEPSSRRGSDPMHKDGSSSPPEPT